MIGPNPVDPTCLTADSDSLVKLSDGRLRVGSVASILLGMLSACVRTRSMDEDAKESVSRSDGCVASSDEKHLLAATSWLDAPTSSVSEQPSDPILLYRLRTQTNGAVRMPMIGSNTADATFITVDSGSEAFDGRLTVDSGSSILLVMLSGSPVAEETMDSVCRLEGRLATKTYGEARMVRAESNTADPTFFTDDHDMRLPELDSVPVRGPMGEEFKAKEESVSRFGLGAMLTSRLSPSSASVNTEPHSNPLSCVLLYRR